MFINLSNHASDLWSPAQRAAAEAWGEIVDLPFPAIDPHADSAEVEALAETYEQRIRSMPQPVVMVQGEYVFTFRLVRRLLNAGIPAMAACSERRTVVSVDEIGQTFRTSVFDFVQFRPY